MRRQASGVCCTLRMWIYKVSSPKRKPPSDYVVNKTNDCRVLAIPWGARATFSRTRRTNGTSHKSDHVCHGHYVWHDNHDPDVQCENTRYALQRQEATITTITPPLLLLLLLLVVMMMMQSWLLWQTDIIPPAPAERPTSSLRLCYAMLLKPSS